LADKNPEILQGKSLTSYLCGKIAEDPEAYAYTVSYGGHDATICTNQWRYTHWGNEMIPKSEELYDHINDPEEYVNLADNPDYKTVLDAMRIKMNAARKKAKNGL
jgi:arylsulfatase A-like enzyme